MQPVCADCEEKMKPDRNGVKVILATSDNEPIKEFNADRWRCNGCGHKIITGFGKSLNYRPDNLELKEKREKQIEQGEMIVADDGSYEDDQVMYVVGG